MRQCLARIAGLLASVALASSLSLPAQTVTVSDKPQWRETDRDGYRKHLETLADLVAHCRKARTAAACDQNQVGPDERVRLSASSQPREIHYDWLRAALHRAAEPEPAPEAAKKDKIPAAIVKQIPVAGAQAEQLQQARPLTVDEQLALAQTRLGVDWKQAGEDPQAAADHAPQRAALKTILARREYQGVAETSVKDRILESIINWLDRLFSKIAGYGEQAHWLGWLLKGLVIGGICVGLVWGLIRIERRSRLRLVPEIAPSSLAPSARDWQLWLEDGRRMAAQGLWREAIHFVYWASISRLESKRMWPADRTRTPREYLALIPRDDARKPQLTALTQSFERTWYGGREAAPADFQTALELAASLGVE